MRKYIYITLFALLLSTPLLGFAQRTLPDTLETGDDVVSLITNIADWMFTVLLVVAVIMFVGAAYVYATASGKEENITRAHKIIIYGVIAVAVGFLANGISFVVEQLVVTSPPSAQLPHNTGPAIPPPGGAPYSGTQPGPSL